MDKVDNSNAALESLDAWVKKYLPYFLCFAAGFIACCVWQIIARRG